jgi:cellulose synthase/poly-beta-1,6-N-acetylglucosamine synthase-like glycosyltransferase
MELFYQKICLILVIFSLYLILTFIFVIYNNIYCKSYNIQDIWKNDDTLSCMILRYFVSVYYFVILTALILTITAAYLVKTRKIKNPYYHIYPRQKRKKILVFIPVYSESLEELEKTIETVVLNDYPLESKNMFIVVDGHKKGEKNNDLTSTYIKQILNVNDQNNISPNINYQVYIGVYKFIKFILMIKKENKGKKDSFIQILKLLLFIQEKQTENYSNHSNANANIQTEITIDNTTPVVTTTDTLYEKIWSISIEKEMEINSIDYILMLDTDTKVDSSGLRILVDYLDSNPFTAAVCGQTNVLNKTYNFISMSQCYEYYITHYTLKSLESVYGDVLVLSGCFSLYRKNILCNKNLIQKYSEEDDSNIYKANLTKLGEDRLLTNLILVLYPHFNTKYIEKAKCYTDAPTNIKTLLCQRRRWTNSMLFCHWMLLKNIPKYTIGKRIRFIYIVLFELWLTLFMPFLLTLGYYYAIKYIITCIITSTHNIFITIQTVVFLCIPIVMCFILKNTNMIKYSITFIFLIPVFGIISPLYSLYKTDDVQWGKTRKTTDILESKVIQPTIPIHISIPIPTPALLRNNSL